MDENGEKKMVYMGSYGMSPSRLMGSVVELNHDEKGIIWPDSVAPFAVHLVSLNQNKETDKIYAMLSDAGIEVLYDDREVSAGEKFADSDLIGIPNRIVVSKKSLETGGAEFKRRNSQESEIVKIGDLVAKISG